MVSFTIYLPDYSTKAQDEVQYFCWFVRVSKTEGKVKLLFPIWLRFTRKEICIRKKPAFCCFKQFLETWIILLIFSHIKQHFERTGIYGICSFWCCFKQKEISKYNQMKFDREVLQRKRYIFTLVWMVFTFIQIAETWQSNHNFLSSLPTIRWKFHV